jgi:hypothetical protein
VRDVASEVEVGSRSRGLGGCLGRAGCEELK